MRVRFTSDFDYKPTKQTTVAYQAGMEMTVKRDCGEKAIAAGKAEEVLGSARMNEGELGNGA